MPARRHHSGSVRERDKGFLQSAKLLIIFAAGVLCVAIFALNPTDNITNTIILKGAEDIIMVCLGARATVCVSDSFEAVMSARQSVADIQQNITVQHKDPKDVMVPGD